MISIPATATIYTFVFFLLSAHPMHLIMMMLMMMMLTMMMMMMTIMTIMMPMSMMAMMATMTTMIFSRSCSRPYGPGQKGFKRRNTNVNSIHSILIHIYSGHLVI